MTEYFRHYLELAKWYDLSDAGRTFASLVPQKALESMLLFSAVIALSTMHISRTTKPSARSVAEYYHALCVKELIALEPNDATLKNGIPLAATCLLRSYEILASESCCPFTDLIDAPICS